MGNRPCARCKSTKWVWNDGEWCNQCSEEDGRPKVALEGKPPRCGARFGHLVCDREPHDNAEQHRGYDTERDVALFWLTRPVKASSMSAQTCGCDPGANHQCEACRNKQPAAST